MNRRKIPVEKIAEICGIGVDIEEVPRFKSMFHKPRLLRKIFTKRELSYCKRFSTPQQCLAARFAGKEAIFKALGENYQMIRINEIEILHQKNSAPYVHLKNKMLKQKGLRCMLSLSHTRDKAIAFAMVLKIRES